MLVKQATPLRTATASQGAGGICKSSIGLIVSPFIDEIGIMNPTEITVCSREWLTRRMYAICVGEDQDFVPSPKGGDAKRDIAEI